MDTNQEEFAVPKAHTRLDTLATSAVLAVMLASILCGVFIVDMETSQMVGSPARVAAIDVIGMAGF